MKVVILCGGQGMRLREETEYRPKPLVDIGGYPILWHVMKTCAHWGHTEFVLCLGYRGWMIKEYFLNYDAVHNDLTIQLGARKQVEYHGDREEQEFKVTLVDTGPETMTGGRLNRVQKYLGDEPFMLTYADGLADIDLDALLAFHKSHDRIATVTSVYPTSRFGIMDLGEQGQVRAFAEKPRHDGWASAGFFVLDPGVFDYLDGGDTCVLEREPIERLVKDDQLSAYKHTGCFYTMDTYRDYVELNRMWKAGDVPWKVWR